MSESVVVAGERHIRPSEERALTKKQQKLDEVANWEDIADSMPDFLVLAEEFRELTDDAKLIEDRRKEIAPQLEAAVVLGGKRKIQGGKYLVNRVEMPATYKLSPEKLVEELTARYTADEIVALFKKCQVVDRKPYSYPLVTRVEDGDVTTEP